MMQIFGLRIDADFLWQKYGVAYVAVFPLLLIFSMTGIVGMSEKSGVYEIRKPYYGVIMMREFFTAVNQLREHCKDEARQ